MMDLRCRRWCAVRTFPAFVEDSETEIGACSAAICFSGAECAEALPMIPVCPRESASREAQMPDSRRTNSLRADTKATLCQVVAQNAPMGTSFICDEVRISSRAGGGDSRKRRR
jgi:hypothetical protein